MADQSMNDHVIRALRELRERGEGYASATGQDQDDILVAIGGGKTTSVGEVNANGEVMKFLCRRADTGPAAVPSGKAVCDGCGADVWMSPATLGVFNKIAKRLVICNECAEPALLGGQE